MAYWASKKLEPHCLEETQQLYCAEFGEQPGLKAADPLASDAALPRNLLLSLVCGNPGEAKRFPELKKVHVPPAIRYVQPDRHCILYGTKSLKKPVSRMALRFVFF
ncbi:MAG: hypothetical protein QOI13_557 [Paraburkholderia sp.]|nr:hypothetical protein [Paraburkholderia sp.]